VRRGEARGAAVQSGPITALAAVLLVALGATAAVVRPWHAERGLGTFAGHRLSLHLRGNALGSHCELEDLTVDDARIPFPCGVSLRAPEYGPVDVVRTEGTETCLVELTPLRQLACVSAWSEWMMVQSDYVAIAQYTGSRERIVVVDRTTGRTNRFEAPPSAYRESPVLGASAPVFRVDGPFPRSFRLEREGFVETFTL
jgi:hypothetical protein